jgi:hypothetical protein
MFRIHKRHQTDPGNNGRPEQSRRILLSDHVVEHEPDAHPDEHAHQDKIREIAQVPDAPGQIPDKS